MNDKLKSLQSILDETVFKENHFTKESKQKVHERIHKSKENRFRFIKKFLLWLKRPVIGVTGTFALCAFIFLLIQNDAWNVGPSSSGKEPIVNESNESEEDGLEQQEEAIFHLPPSILEQIELQLQKSADSITMDDLEEVKSLIIDEEMNVASVVSLMENIQTLSIHVPMEDWTFFEEIPNVEELTISRNDLDNLTFLKPLLELKMLSIEGNELKSLEGIEHLTKLHSLYASQNQLSQVEPLQGLNALTMLELTDNQISSLEPIQNLIELRNLYIGQNPITDGSVIGKLPNLKFLFMNGLELTSFDFLKEVTSLNRLILSDTTISDLSVLSSSKALTYLDIRNTNVTTIEPLADLNNLNILLLDKTKVTDWESLNGIKGLHISEETILAE